MQAAEKRGLHRLLLRPSAETFICPNAGYTLTENPLSITSLLFIRQEAESSVKICLADGREYTLRFAWGRETRGKMYFIKHLQEHLQKYVCRVTDTQPHLLELCLYYIETPYVCHYTFVFEGERIKMHFTINGSFTRYPFTAEGTLMQP